MYFIVIEKKQDDCDFFITNFIMIDYDIDSDYKLKLMNFLKIELSDMLYVKVTGDKVCKKFVFDEQMFDDMINKISNNCFYDSPIDSEGRYLGPNDFRIYKIYGNQVTKLSSL